MVSCSSFWASELDRPNGAMRATNRSISALVRSSSYAASTIACSADSNSSSTSVHVVDVPASRAAFSA